MFFLFCKGFWPKVVSLIIFMIAAVTDFCDGWLANKKNMTTDFGKLMDPFADK
ncbi:MAG: CDP-alcohol phosphatidyltransferase family protein, partial [Candidatus Omnitrophica bacterium]|nr:CDP-alcohol phosphatidyltransferase family protein [Candidatus Omnitrophota bacterium]